MKGFGRLVRRAFSHQTRSFQNPRYQNNDIRFFISLQGFVHASSSSSTHLVHQFHRSGFASLKSSPVSPSPLTKWGLLGGQKRSMFIQTQSTPNPSSLMFYPGKPVMDVGSADFPNARSAMGSPLAKALYGIDGITRVFYGSDFITVTKSEDASWDFLKPEIFAAIMDFYSSGQPLFLDSETAAAKDTAINEDDSETVAMIKELLETRIRPAVQDDGGDIEYRGFDPETGVVKLRMQGACSGCPSSSVTLKSGIENMLMHYVPEAQTFALNHVLLLQTNHLLATGCSYIECCFRKWNFAFGCLFCFLLCITLIGLNQWRLQVKAVEQELDAEDEDAALAGQVE